MIKIYKRNVKAYDTELLLTVNDTGWFVYKTTVDRLDPTVVVNDMWHTNTINFTLYTLIHELDDMCEAIQLLKMELLLDD